MFETLSQNNPKIKTIVSKFPLKQQSAKTVRTYIRRKIELALNESVWT